MTNKSGRTRQRTKNLRDELIWGRAPSGDKGWCIIAPIIPVIVGIFNKKRKCCNYRCPDFVHFYALLLIIYLSAIQALICRREMILVGSTSLGFAQNTIHDFQNTEINFDKYHTKCNALGYKQASASG